LFVVNSYSPKGFHFKKDPDGIANGASHRAGVPLSRANLCIWLKNRAILGWSKFVSAYVERDKKIMKKWIFNWPRRHQDAKRFLATVLGTPYGEHSEGTETI